MKKIAVAATTTFALALAGVSLALSGGVKTDSELRRVDCRTITMFTPAQKKSAEELCANYGGVAEKNSGPTEEGLVILVRNQPMGGFAGENSLH